MFCNNFPLANGNKRAVSLCSVSVSRGYTSTELDTVFEERSDPEQTQTTDFLMTPDSPSVNEREHFQMFRDS